MLSKLFATISLSIQNYLAYRLNFFMEVCIQIFAVFFIRYNIWSAIYADYDTNVVVNGYDVNTMLAFQCWAMVTELIVYAYNGQYMAVDIRLGKISSFLLYPVPFTFYQFGRFLGLMLIQVLIALLSIGVLYAYGFIADISTLSIVAGVSVCIMGASIWYAINFMSATIAFWMEETWFLRATAFFIGRLLGGAIVPLEFFSDNLREVCEFLPFSYLVYYPSKIFMGDLSNFGQVVSVLFIWNLILGLMACLLWKVGMKSYTAAGA